MFFILDPVYLVKCFNFWKVVAKNFSVCWLSLQWSMSRPLLGLILLNEEVSISFFMMYCRRALQLGSVEERFFAVWVLDFTNQKLVIRVFLLITFGSS